MVKINQQSGKSGTFEGGTATFPDMLIRSGRDPDKRENVGREK